MCAVIAGALALTLFGFKREHWHHGAAFGTSNGFRLAAVKGAIWINTFPATSRDEMVTIWVSGGWWPSFIRRSPETTTCIPLWILVVLSAVPTALLWRRDHILTKRARAGRCPKCNYDLSGLAAGAACPECGPKPP